MRYILRDQRGEIKALISLSPFFPEKVTKTFIEGTDT